MRVAIVIQARMGSTRLPGKSLMDLAGQPLLGQLLTRLERVDDVAPVVVATSDTADDDPIHAYCESLGVPCHRGSEHDVLGRYADVVRALDLDAVIRACGDAPLTDPEGIREVWSHFTLRTHAYVHNRFDSGWPIGTAVDAIDARALLDAQKRATQPHEREHVVPFLHDRPAEYPALVVSAPRALRRPGLHLAIDVASDLERMRTIFTAFRTPGGPTLEEAIRFLDAHPDLRTEDLAS